MQPADASKPPTCATCAGGALMAAGAFTCPLGHGRQGGCELWQPCSPCPAGAYAATTSDMLWDVCRACPAGSFSNTNAATSCVPCQPGTTTISAGSTACVPCPAGTYGVAVTGTVGGVAAVTGAACVPCPPGTYSGAEGVVGSCTGCPAGRTHFLQGRTNASDCAVPLDTSGGGSSRTIRMQEVVSWLDVGTSFTGGSAMNVRNERVTPGREVQVAVNGPAAGDVGSLVYETDTEKVLTTSTSSPIVTVKPLSPPVPVGVTAYQLFQLAPGTCMGAVAWAWAWTSCQRVRVRVHGVWCSCMACVVRFLHCYMCRSAEPTHSTGCGLCRTVLHCYAAPQSRPTAPVRVCMCVSRVGLLVMTRAHRRLWRRRAGCCVA